jgi:hypothetical protein
MFDQFLWRIGGVFLFICFIFFIFFFVSFFVYRHTKGRIYQIFIEQPKRFLVSSFIASILFGFVSMMPDLANILLSPLMIEPVNINHSIVFAVIQCLLILIFGPPVVWLSYKLAIPLAHRILHHHF